jgi:NitT/TauT family transport system permease protein
LRGYENEDPQKAPRLNKLVTLVWVLAIIVIWELCAFEVEAVKRTPENILPHIWQIVASVFSTAPVSSGKTAIDIVLISAGSTLLRAGYGFLIGMAFGFVLALLMKLSGVIEKIAFPYLMLIQMIPILGMAPIVLAITHDIGVSRVVIAAILTYYPVSTNTLAGFKAVERKSLTFVYLRRLKNSGVPENAYPFGNALFFFRAENFGADGYNRLNTCR